MAALVHLMRHGEVHNPDHLVYSTLPGFGLSERGRGQAREAAGRLRGRPVVAIWSSPLQRALETAEVIAGGFGLPVLVDEELIEWRLTERWAGLRWEDLGERRPGELDAYLSRPLESDLGSETLDGLARRVTEALVRIERRHRDGEVVVVGHQDPIQAARLTLTGRPLDRLHDDKPGHASLITLSPGREWREVESWVPSGASQPLEKGGVGVEGEVGEPFE